MSNMTSATVGDPEPKQFLRIADPVMAGLIDVRLG